MRQETGVRGKSKKKEGQKTDVQMFKLDLLYYTLPDYIWVGGTIND